jgi:hypothetical protein
MTYCIQPQKMRSDTLPALSPSSFVKHELKIIRFLVSGRALDQLCLQLDNTTFP